ncbi:flagellar motor protein MotB [Jeotgalibaca ciconiae]|uniref:Chemotaxis protein MotB n=1 Tax=Jeotgalibaca ciconiae TaxID=2496265 RepID=A0A3Q9BK48_9LACT|nr:flagellar motor protein MotB [Jeotgalibaca ciconiae]AZP04281.1 chemotaxis protein MotB [Jeotgalibaca ciconiae]
MRKKKKKEVQSAGSPLWMTTFSDLVTLLLTFFILLFSMSSVSDDKFNKMASSLSGAFTGGNGILDGIIMPPEELVDEQVDEAVDTSSFDPELLDMYHEVYYFVQEHGLEDKISLTADQDGIYVNMNSTILFGVESSAVSTDGRELLTSVAELINRFENKIIVEGYTDDIPNQYGQYPTNWELSVSRAVSVVRYLSENESVDPNRLSAVGYGEHKPLVPNDSAANRAKNRRVNIVVVYEREE